jgi:hypothetical protein
MAWPKCSAKYTTVRLMLCQVVVTHLHAAGLPLPMTKRSGSGKHILIIGT